MEFTFQTVKRGNWIHNGFLKKGIDIVAVTYVYGKELEELLEQWGELDENIILNRNGLSFKHEWYDAGFEIMESENSAGISLEEAVTKAEQMVRQKIEWVDKITWT